MTNMRWIQSGYARLALVALIFGLVAGCALPPLENRTVSSALDLESAGKTRLGQAFSRQAAAHPGKSGIHPLVNPHHAFASRVLLARVAERTLDVQYYIWHGDMTGTLLLEALHAAADRGVRVRLLLDDNGTSGLDRELAALDSHPHIEVRLFNPFVVRRPKWLGFLTDFSRLNRRMHNKSFTADNQATIIGGRNVGDAYFGATREVLFADLDVFAVGPVVDAVSRDFDRYWESASAYPAGLVLPPVESGCLAELAQEASIVERDPAARAYMKALRESDFVEKVASGALSVAWANTRMVSDDPAKGLGRAEPEGLLTQQLAEILGVPARDVELVSPYFVPTASGVDAFGQMAGRGVNVRVLTNSLDATDVTAVHAGYAKRRKGLLEAGVKLYELRRLSPEIERNRSAGPFGSSGSSLHAKTFAVDRERVFVGSFNFDPRSVDLNTELGFVIESPAMAGQIDDLFNEWIPANAYEVRLGKNGRLYWLERQGRNLVRHDREPHTGPVKNLWIQLLSMLPIEWLL